MGAGTDTQPKLDREREREGEREGEGAREGAEGETHAPIDIH